MPRKEKGLEWPLVAGVTPARKTKGWRRERSETIIYANETCAELEYISSITWPENFSFDFENFEDNNNNGKKVGWSLEGDDDVNIVVCSITPTRRAFFNKRSTSFTRPHW